MVVQFEGPDRKIIEKAKPLIVSILDLKKAFDWLLTHSWAWIEATRKDDVNILEKKYGRQVDELLHAYEQSLEGKLEGVPKEVLRAATSILREDETTTPHGPAEVAAKEQRTEAISAVLIDNGSSSGLAVQQMEEIMRHHDTLVRADGRKAEASDDQTQLAELQLELFTVREAKAALHRLSSRKIREELISFHEHEQVDPVLLLKIPCDTNRPLSGYSPDFWEKCFVDVFCRGDCKEMAGSSRVGRLTDTEWTELLLNRVDLYDLRMHREWQATAYKTFLRRSQIKNVENVGGSRT